MRGYGETEFREDLKTLYKLLGTKEVVFLFTDAHVALEGFLEFLNNMLTTGMVPALYEQDEMDGAYLRVLRCFHFLVMISRCRGSFLFRF